jgi:hypothetical protein
MIFGSRRAGRAVIIRCPGDFWRVEVILQLLIRGHTAKAGLGDGAVRRLATRRRHPLQLSPAFYRSTIHFEQYIEVYILHGLVCFP